VADLVKPRPQEKEVQVYTEDQVKALLAASRPHRLHALFALAVYSGMRQGELLALHWPAIDFERDSVQVLKTLRMTKDVGFTLEPPKSKRSRRTIDLPQVAMVALREHRERMRRE